MSTINAKKQTPTYIGPNWTLAGDFDKKKKTIDSLKLIWKTWLIEAELLG